MFFFQRFRFSLAWPIYLLAALHIPYFVYALIHSNSALYTSDSFEYLWQAFNIRHFFSNYCGDPALPIRPELYTRRTVLYAFFILICKLFSNRDIFIILIQNLVSVWFISWLFKYSTRISGNRHKGSILLAFIFYPTWFIYTNMLMTELLMSICITIATLNLVQYFKTSRPICLIFYSIVATLALLIKPVLVFFIVIHILLVGYLFFQKMDWKHGLALLIMPLVFVLHSYMGYRLTGYFHYSSIVNHNLLHYNSEEVFTNLEGKEKAKLKTAAIQLEADNIADFKQYNAYIRSKSTSIIKSHPVTYAKLHLRGMLNFFLDPGRFDMNQFFNLDSVTKFSFFSEINRAGFKGLINYLRKISFIQTSIIILILLWNLMLVAAFIYFIFSKVPPWQIKLPILIFIGYIWLITGLMGSSRFRMEIWPLLILTLPYFLNSLYQWRSRKFAIHASDS